MQEYAQKQFDRADIVRDAASTRNLPHTWNRIRFAFGKHRYQHTDRENGVHGTGQRGGTGEKSDRQTRSGRSAQCEGTWYAIGTTAGEGPQCDGNATASERKTKVEN